ncbi:MAG TPA: transcriptional regulator GutM [Nocardioidaceae bacterium]|jgi:glucitol operon activator protein|nr:transcriptional regulator GutM [Nocardioidaceae bacterium]
MSSFLLIVAVVAGWMVQMYLTFRQSMAFNKEVASMRHRGTVSVGVAGKRYRGGRAFVAVAIDDRGVVRDALTLTGFTTFSRAKPLVGLLDVATRRILADQPLPGLNRQQQEAARQAVDLAKTRVPV